MTLDYYFKEVSHHKPAEPGIAQTRDWLPPDVCLQNARERCIATACAPLLTLGNEHTHAQARKHCRATEAVVAEYKAGAARIEALCRAIGEGMLVDVERKRLYELPEFEAVQAAHIDKVSGLAP